MSMATNNQHDFDDARETNVVINHDPLGNIDAREPTINKMIEHTANITVRLDDVDVIRDATTNSNSKRTANITVHLGVQFAI